MGNWFQNFVASFNAWFLGRSSVVLCVTTLALGSAHELSPPKVFGGDPQRLELAGMEVVPHQFSARMKWRRPPDPELSARVSMFLRNTSDTVLSIQNPRWNGESGEALVRSGEWAWHDPKSTSGFELPAGALRVVRWNGSKARWGVGNQFEFQWQEGADPGHSQRIELPSPDLRIESAVFFNSPTNVYPTKMIATVRNATTRPAVIRSCRLWLPKSNDTFVDLYPQVLRTDLHAYPESGIVLPGDMAGIELDYDALPLSYAAIEIVIEDQESKRSSSLWAYLRIRPASFDISGGWIASEVEGGQALAQEAYWKTLALMSVNTGQIEEVGGYTDRPEIYAQYPIKRFNRLGDRNRYDTDAMLPSIHAVEFLGEPQYGGGRPVPPQEVYDQLAPYHAWKLPTSVTLSEERTWRYYSGLSDYPHYDAYRVIAPAADAWSSYDRWGGKSIRWGSPLETIGDMTRSLRAQSRPATIAYWSQGAHDGWGGFLSPRRSSPTPDELRSQAWHGLGNGIASLYWFNLSVKSLCKFPDLIDPIARVGREIHLLKDLLERGTSYEYVRLEDANRESPQWDLSSIADRDALLMVANDLAYTINESNRTFQFEARDGEFEFRIPPWLQDATHVYRLDADGSHDVEYDLDASSRKVVIRDRVQVVGIYVLAKEPAHRARIDGRYQARMQYEQSLHFDPAKSAEDLRRLKALPNDR